MSFVVTISNKSDGAAMILVAITNDFVEIGALQVMVMKDRVGRLASNVTQLHLALKIHPSFEDWVRIVNLVQMSVSILLPFVLNQHIIFSVHDHIPCFPFAFFFFFASDTT